MAGVQGVAARGWGFAALGVQAQDGCGARKHAAAVVADDVDQEPWKGIGVGRRCICSGLTGNTATVVRFPCRSGEMLTEGFAFGVEKLGVRSLQRPGELRAITLATVDLVALRMDQKKLFLCGRLDWRRDLLRGKRSGK